MFWTVLGLLVRSALVMVFAQGLRRLPRHTSPAHRHAVLVTGFALLLVWPLFPLFVPELNIPLAFHARLQGSVTVQEWIKTSSTAQRLPVSTILVSAIWVLGVAGALLPLVWGYRRASSQGRRGATFPDGSLRAVIDECRGRSGLLATATILLVRERIVPQTYGIFRPVILLPEECLSWSDAKLKAVLLHEFAHIKRHDAFWQALVNVTTACWWFQPLCWFTRSSVREESELACDAAVLRSGMQPTVYAAELLAIAKAFRTPSYQRWSALPMVAPGSLELRLRSVLHCSPPSMREQRFTPLASLLLFLLATVCSGLSLFTDGRFISEGGVSMRRTVFPTLFSGLLASASLSAASIGGSIFDPTGAAVSNAKASLYNAETKARQETVSVADGKFGFDHLQAGQYILRVDKSGFAPILRAFNIEQDSTVDRGLTFSSGSDGSPARNDAGSVAPAGSRVVRVGGQVAQTNLVNKVQPVYPDAAKASGIQGAVRLEALISAEGVPQDIRVVSSPGEDLSQSALDAVRQWRYRPTLLNGSPVAIVTEIDVNYTLAP